MMAKKKPRAVFVVCSYLLLVIGFPVIEETCCRDHHLDDVNELITNSVSIEPVEDHLHQHESHDEIVHSHSGHTVGCFIKSENCCSGHQHSVAHLGFDSHLLSIRPTPISRIGGGVFPTTVSYRSSVLGIGLPLTSDYLLALSSPASTIHTTVLLI